MTEKEIMLKSLKRTRVVFNYKHQLLKHSKPEIVNHVFI
jgi:hypothetical protein